jgi:hypothetical protein
MRSWWTKITKPNMRLKAMPKNVFDENSRWKCIVLNFEPASDYDWWFGFKQDGKRLCLISLERVFNEKYR